jgi:hypothetical protein
MSIIAFSIFIESSAMSIAGGFQRRVVAVSDKSIC